MKGILSDTLYEQAERITYEPLLLNERNIETKIVDTSEIKTSPPESKTTTVCSDVLPGECCMAIRYILEFILLKKNQLSIKK